MLKSSRLGAMTEMQARMMVSHYYAKVSLVDHGVGMVLNALADKGILDDTWIVYTSDHGEMLGDHRLKQKKVFYEGALNVPLIVRPPGVASGHVRVPARRDGVADHLDVCATLLQAGGAAPLPESLGQPLVSAQGDPTLCGHRNYAFSEVESYYSMARDERYKMTIDSAGRVPLELYDMLEDPRELTNLVDDPGHKTVRERFLDEAFTELGFDDTNLDAFRDRLAAGPYRDTFASDLLRQFN